MDDDISYKSLVDAGRKGDVSVVRRCLDSHVLDVNNQSWNLDSSVSGYTPLMAIVAAPDLTSPLLTQSNCDEIVRMFCQAVYKSKKDVKNAGLFMSMISIFEVALTPFRVGEITSKYYLFAVLKFGDSRTAYWNFERSSDVTTVDGLLSPLDVILTAFESDGAVDLSDSNGRTALFYAFLRYDLAMVKLLINLGVDVNVRDSFGNTLLNYINGDHLPYHYDVVSCAKILIEAGADVNSQNDRSETPLFRALNSKYLEMVSLLIKSGVDVNIKLKDGSTALHHYCKTTMFNRIPWITSLINAGADVNALDLNGNTPLHIVNLFSNGSIPQVSQMLIAAGADVNIRNRFDRSYLDYRFGSSSGFGFSSISFSTTPQDNMDSFLIAACKLCNVALIKSLIAQGVDVNDVGEHGTNPLFIACRQGNIEIATLLIQAGADVNLLNCKSDSPLTVTIQTSSIDSTTRVDLVSLLINAGADVNEYDNELTHTPMYASTSNNLCNITALLIKSGAKIQDNKGEPWVHFTSRLPVEALSLLLQAGMNVNSINNEGLTPLVLTSLFGNQGMTDFLIRSNADVHIRCGDGSTLLHRVVSQRNPYDSTRGIFETLIKGGSDMTSVSYDGFTCLHLACSFKLSPTEDISLNAVDVILEMAQRYIH